MLKVDLLPILKTEASFLGLKPIDDEKWDRKWRDWIDEKIIESATPKGRTRGANPLWQYRSGTAERALAVLRLRANGVTRYSAIRLHLWLLGYELPSSKIKADLISEFERLIKKNFFSKFWSFDANDPDAHALEKIANHKKKLQAVDPTLEAAGMKPSADAILALGSKLFWGPDSKSDALQIFTKELGKKIFFTENLIRNLIKDAEPYVAAMIGLFGNPEEIAKSGLSELKKIGVEDLNKGRVFYQSLCGLHDVSSKILSLGNSEEIVRLQWAFDKSAKSLKGHEWTTVSFALGALASFRKREARSDANR